jgi:SAM-dependent methyltransferase
MLKILKAKVAELPENKRTLCEVIQSDMRDFELKNTYSLAFITRGGFIHLTSSKDQRQTLLNVHRHLKPKGVLVFTTFDPNYEMILSGLKGKPVEPFLRYTYTNSKGNQEKVYNLSVHDPATQIIEVIWTWEETNPKGEVVSKRDRLLRCRWTFRQETEYLLELTGFKVLALYGGFSKEAPVPGGKTNLWVCEKK